VLSEGNIVGNAKDTEELPWVKAANEAASEYQRVLESEQGPITGSDHLADVYRSVAAANTKIAELGHSSSPLDKRRTTDPDAADPSVGDPWHLDSPGFIKMPEPFTLAQMTEGLIISGGKDKEGGQASPNPNPNPNPN